MNRIVIIVVAIIVIIALTFSGVVLFGMDLLSDNKESLAVLEVGTYVEYNRTRSESNNSDIRWVWTNIITIVAMNDTHYFINIAGFGPAIPNWTDSANTSWHKDWIFGLEGSFANSSANYTKVGITYVDTNWGLLNCDHYTGSFAIYSFDLFVKNGILIKRVMTCQGTIGSGGKEFYVIDIATDTNIPEITNSK